MKRIVILVLCSIILLITIFYSLSACRSVHVEQKNVQTEEYTYYDPNEACVYPILTVEHAEDYVIEWEDEGMEAHVRFLLDKPEEDILHSDVWNIHYFSIAANHDALLEEPAEGEVLHAAQIDENKALWMGHSVQLPAVCSLRDLRHFDSLQILSIEDSGHPQALTDISGPEACENLQYFFLSSAAPESWEPISNMRSLEWLNISACSMLDVKSLEGLANLSALSIGSTKIDSLEPVVSLPIKYLRLWNGTTNKHLHDALDFKLLAQLNSLIYLDVTNNAAFTDSDCKLLLENLEQLETVDLSFTAAADVIDYLVETYPDIRFLCNGKLSSSELVVK